jgi:hypothetical protein
MAMDSDVLGLAVAKVLMDRSTIPPTPDMIINIQQFWKDVCKEFVDHIQDNARVLPGIALTAGGESGVTTGEGNIS